MANLSLASRYRPQSFAEVGGQELITSALSRTAASGSPASAYLLSGTRGVGKTTIARIFAKALNCERGPAAEPCNDCQQCRKVTEGRHVDVCEIDGASNNRVEDARSLRETIGYAPMEGRYKVFIIDEAHMLSNSAFNALLKTLEEPPPQVVFIFATTEAHKFPVTIVSRCQHFVFRHLSQEALANHIAGILQKENRTFDQDAIQIIAKRAQGSARDSMSLLDQIFAFAGEGHVGAETARTVLGLAGQEIFESLFTALAAGDMAAIIETTRQILQKGLDIGYFAREFSTALRNLFLLRETGEKMAASLGLTENEKNFFINHAQTFSSPHLHAAWQLALDSQREIIQNPEPGAALEMLFLNIAILPQLLPVEAASDVSRAVQQPRIPQKQQKTLPEGYANFPPKEFAATDVYSQSDVHETVPIQNGGKTWDGFRDFCAGLREKNEDAPGMDMLSAVTAQIEKDRIILNCVQTTAFENIQKRLALLQRTIESYFGHINIEMRAATQPLPEYEMKVEMEKHPELQACIKILDARIKHCKIKS